MVHYDAITKIIIGGRLVKWSSRLSSSRLTSFYDFFHKVCTSNWARSNNITIVTQTHAQVIYQVGYQVGTGLPFDLGQLIFDEITFYTESSSSSWSLPFPSLINSLLHAQGVHPFKNERSSTQPTCFGVNQLLLKDENRVVDFPLVYLFAPLDPTHESPDALVPPFQC